MRASVLFVLCLAALPVESKKEKVRAFPGIFKHIACDVCTESVRQLVNLVKWKQEKRPKLRLREDEINDLMEKSCDPRLLEGRWMRYLDISVDAKANKLAVVDSGIPAKLKKKTRSIADACSAVLLGDSDLTAFLYSGKKTSKWLANYVCVEGGDSGDRGPCHKKYKKGVLPAKLLKAVQGEDLVEADEKELAAEKQMGEMKKMPGMPEEAMQLYTRDDVEDLAVYEMMKEGMDEDEARKMYKELKESGYLDNPDAHLHHANEGGEAEEEEANGSPGGDDL